MEIAVDVAGLSKHFGSFRAVDNVSFQVGRGEIFGFLGPNGAGKSTTIQMLCGVLPPTSGKGTVLGMDIRTESYAIKERIGYMSQKFGLYQDLTVTENLAFAGTLFGVTGRRLLTRQEELMEQFDLRESRQQLAGSLPTGFRQRLALACALINHPPMLFLDEPTSGVDPEVRRKFWDVLYGLSERGITMMVTTHYMDEAEHCTNLGFIYAGKIVALGRPTSIKAHLKEHTFFEVAASPIYGAQAALRDLPEIAAVDVHGAVLRVCTRAGVSMEDHVVREYLERRGLTVQWVEAASPTLEDVFSSLTSAHGVR